MIIELQRDLHTPNETLGYLSVNGRKWTTIERPWIPDPAVPCGAKGRSCVPKGTYRLEPHSTDAHPKAWALVNTRLLVFHWPWEVPVTLRESARTVCLIHPANWASELRGCIALGKSRIRDRDGHWMIRDSRDAVNELRTVLGAYSDLQLVIT